MDEEILIANDKPTTTMNFDKRYIEWLQSGDTGISSETMFSVLTGIPVSRNGSPHDMADVGRCIRMLRRLPELRPRIKEVSIRFKSWTPYIDCWKELEREYDKCVEWEKIPLEERKKIMRRKYSIDPHENAWQLMRRLDVASMYLSGMRMQGSSSYWKNEPCDDL